MLARHSLFHHSGRSTRLLTRYSKRIIIRSFIWGCVETFPQIGKTYKIEHSRKGVFEGRVTRISEDTEWVDVEITRGQTTAMCRYNVADVGDYLSLRREFCTFTNAG